MKTIRWGVFEDGDVEDHSVIYYEEKWETINFHFTKAAAEAFIKRKGHDYGELQCTPMRTLMAGNITRLSRLCLMAH